MRCVSCDLPVRREGTTTATPGPSTAAAAASSVPDAGVSQGMDGPLAGHEVPGGTNRRTAAPGQLSAVTTSEDRLPAGSTALASHTETGDGGAATAGADVRSRDVSDAVASVHRANAAVFKALDCATRRVSAAQDGKNPTELRDALAIIQECGKALQALSVV